MKYTGLLICLFFCAGSITILNAQSNKSNYDYVNPFIGTGGEGHTYPGATVPFGMVQLSPDTDIRFFKESFPWCAGYRYEDSTILGFSHTHFSGTGHSDLGDILIMPFNVDININQKDGSYSPAIRSAFSHSEESSKPGYYSVMLKDYNIKAELTATRRTGYHRYSYFNSGSSHFLLDLVSSIYNYDGKVLMANISVKSDRLITGYRQTKGWAPNRYIFFAIEFSKPFLSYTLLNQDTLTVYKGTGRKGAVYENYPELYSKKLKAIFNFNVAEKEQIMVKVGISSVDINGALGNIESELKDADFDQVVADAKAEWEKELSAITVDGSEKQKEIFYTSLYHTFLAPTLYMDSDRRYRGIDNCIHTAEGFDNYTTFSLWDTYRALHPLFTLIQPVRTVDMIKSMLAHQKQSAFGILPIWSFHANEDWCMIGYHAVSVIADAYLKGIRGFDPSVALTAMIRSASCLSYGGLEHYIKYGFTDKTIKVLEQVNLT